MFGREKEGSDDGSKRQEVEALKEEVVTKPAPVVESAPTGSGRAGGKKKRKKNDQVDW